MQKSTKLRQREVNRKVGLLLKPRRHLFFSFFFFLRHQPRLHLCADSSTTARILLQGSHSTSCFPVPRPPCGSLTDRKRPYIRKKKKDWNRGMQRARVRSTNLFFSNLRIGQFQKKKKETPGLGPQTAQMSKAPNNIRPAPFYSTMVASSLPKPKKSTTWLSKKKKKSTTP